MRVPLSSTPLVEPRSAIMTAPSSCCLMTAWKRETLVWLRTRSLALPRPTVVTGLVISRMPRLPSGAEMMRRAIGRRLLLLERDFHVCRLALFDDHGLGRRLVTVELERDLVAAGIERHLGGRAVGRGESVHHDL